MCNLALDEDGSTSMTVCFFDRIGQFFARGCFQNQCQSHHAAGTPTQFFWPELPFAAALRQLIHRRMIGFSPAEWLLRNIDDSEE